MRAGNKGGVATPYDPDEAKNAQTSQASKKNRDARVITIKYSNPVKESIPPPRMRTEQVIATSRTRSLTAGLT